MEIFDGTEVKDPEVRKLEKILVLFWPRVNFWCKAEGWPIVEEPNWKKCVIKGDIWSVKGPTKNLYILNAEVVLMHPIQLSGPYQDSKYEGLQLGP